MRKMAIWLILAGLAMPAFAASRVTVEQLERMLANDRAKSDAELAKQLGDLELSERVISARLEQLQTNLPGEKSRKALVALADTSAFLEPPSTDIPATARPDAATQRHILSLTVDYLGKTLPLLPNLFAARDTVRFETRAESLQGIDSADNPLREASKSRVTVLYRDGREFVDAGAGKDKKPHAPDKGLTTWGEFGPILGTVLIDAARSRLAWSHWELAASGPQAVFHYSVPKEKSHYDVRFCCVAEAYGFESSVVTERVGYHGEITVDPDSGTILRLTVLADIDPENPIGQADIAVEYGPVAIGGKTYFCPVRGIALAKSPDLKAVQNALIPSPAAGAARTAPTLQRASLASIAEGPRQTLLNDVAFREFHLFRADSKLIVGNETSAASHTAASSLPASTAPAGTETPETAKPAEDTAVESSSLAPQPAVTGSPIHEPSAGLAEGTPAEAVIPEITVADASGLPNAPALAQSGADSAVTLRLNARLVDVPLVALDKKGRPITNLKPEDLQIYDNAVKVDLRSFAQTGGAPAGESALSAQPSASVAGQPAFSNRRAASAKAATGEPQANTIILLLDTNLSFDDLTNVREQMVHFLNDLHNNERVGLFAMKVGAFQVIQEPATDHALLAATLAKWRPSAQSISLGEEQEDRNRQKMETVHSPEDLLNVNGLSQSDSGINTEALDAKLRELGDHPGQNALSGLVDVARHLGALPGHKSLVWVASDNVLADWNNASLNIDKGDKFIDAAALRTQEAMNDAHVSVYPLDASRLEAGGIDASIGTRNVELTPTFQRPPVLEQALEGPEASAGQTLNIDQSRELNPGRAIAQMQQDAHSIQGAYREIADATGGRVFRRANDMVSEFNSVVADGRATYLLSFTPAQAADGKYHLISVKIAGRKDVKLQYRTGFFYREEPTTIKDRFSSAVLEPEDATGIALSADPLPGSNGHTLKLAIAATDLAIAQKDAFWTDKLDVYVVQREVSGTKAHVTGQTMGLRLKPATYQQYLREGIPFNQAVEAAPGVGSVRIVVVDENSGRMGSVTIPANAIGRAQ
jgi:VWFA-related protein